MTKHHRKTVEDILRLKQDGVKLTMLTAYDYPLAAVLDHCGVDIILVGDSLANVVLGLDSTKQVGMDVMLHHARAVGRAVANALLVADMPYEALHNGPDFAVECARRFIRDAGCDAVKMEWFEGCLSVTEALLGADIPVMSHIGLTPQTADQIGGFKVQGKNAASARRLFQQARAFERRGVFSLVLECIPDEIARQLTEGLRIPTIGIGAGVHCDGQVLVTHDMIGFYDRFKPKFAKQYLQINPLIMKAVEQFRQEVAAGEFPDAAHSFRMNPEEADKFKDMIDELSDEDEGFG